MEEIARYNIRQPRTALLSRCPRLLGVSQVALEAPNVQMKCHSILLHANRPGIDESQLFTVNVPRE